MQQQLKDLLLQLGVTEEEMQTIVNLAPMFEDISLQEFVDSTCVLVEYGYPQEDIPALLLVNPNIFVLTKETLQAELKNIQQAYGDVEEALKQNPFLI